MAGDPQHGSVLEEPAPDGIASDQGSGDAAVAVAEEIITEAHHPGTPGTEAATVAPPEPKSPPEDIPTTETDPAETVETAGGGVAERKLTKLFTGLRGHAADFGVRTRDGAVARGRRLREIAADPWPWLRTRTGDLWALSRRHPVFTVILVMAVLLRVVTMLGYRPAMYFNDSFDYLHVAMKPYPHPLRPDGYSFLLLILRPFHSFALVTAVQHLMGLAMGVMIYALLRHRFRLPGWGAAMAAAPLLLDAYQIQLEHLILSDVMFTFLVVSAVTLLLWHDRPTWKIAASIGVIIGMAWLTRSVGLPVLVGVLVCMMIGRMGWKTVAITLAACALPVVTYMGWYKVDRGKFAITESNGIFLFSRTYKFADCHKIKKNQGLPVEQMPLCTERQGDGGSRQPNSQDGIWNAASPLNRFYGPRFGPDQNKVANDFAKRAILSQPTDYLRVVAHDFFRVFQWKRTVFPDPATYQMYEFGRTSSALPNWRMDNDTTAADEAVAYERGRARTKVVEPFAGVIRFYQDHIYLRGSLVGMILLVGLAGLVSMWRRFGGAAFLPWSLATGLLLVPAATAEFDYRYVLPSVPLACLAAAITFSPEVRERLRGLRRRRTAEEKPVEPVEEPVPSA